jgi:N-acetyl-anhydromuramyl-L-alanine amidase AmpD
VESIHEAHLKNKDKNGKSWLGIGYHFVIGNGNGMGDGDVEPTFRWREQMHGAHAGVAEYNQRGIGIVLVGNFESHPPTSRQLKAAKQLVAALAAEYGVTRDRVMGHGDVKATECPGRYFPLSEVRDSVAIRPGQVFSQAAPAPFSRN